MSQFLQLTFNYDGRSEGGGAAVHTARVEARGYFFSIIEMRGPSYGGSFPGGTVLVYSSAFRVRFRYTLKRFHFIPLQQTSDSMSFLSELNSVQQEAVKTLNGPVMIIAGAGSGKTRVLRIAWPTSSAAVSLHTRSWR